MALKPGDVIRGSKDASGFLIHMPFRIVGRLVKPLRKAPGSMPGMLVHTGQRKMESTRITFLDYDEASFREQEVDGVERVLPLRDLPTVSWINVDGLHDVEVIRELGQHFGLHPLVMEDLVHVGQRPKEEVYDAYIYVVLSMLSWDAEQGQVVEEQLSLVVGPNWVLTFQERIGDFFEPVRERLRGRSGKIRSRGADYLAYALIDAVVDRYYQVLEAIGEVTEALELELLDDPTEATMRRLHDLKRELVALRRSVAPVREVANGLIREDTALMSETTRVFLRDVHDHAVQVTDAVESLRDLVSGMMDLYLSTISFRTNEVMKVLTIMASIFIPLSFLAGLYGMNFQYMPELGWRWGYPALVGVMLALSGGMLLYFRRRGWL